VTEELRVRRATGDDVGDITTLEADAFPLDPWSANLVAQGVDDTLPTVSYLVAELGGTFAGYAVISVAVVPGLRRTGVASALLEAARAHAASEGAGRLLLEVREDNAPALGFYARHGFTELGRRPGYYRDGTTALVLSTPVTMAP
jgi:ribosomal-protein-alanine N-acetyltransferase